MQGMQKTVPTLLALSLVIATSALAESPKGADAAPERNATPTSAPATKPAEPAEFSVRFHFDGIPYMDVIRRFAQSADKPLLGEAKIEGKLTFIDHRPYSYIEALDTLNTILSMKGFALREEGRFLRVRPLAEMPSTTKIFPAIDQAVDLSPSEIVTVMIPVKHVPPDSISKALEKMVSSFGSISPLVKGQGVIITDRISNIRRLQGMIVALDVETFVHHKLRTYALKHASAKVAAGILNKLFGTTSIRTMVWDVKAKKLIPRRLDPKTILSVSFDERANIVILVGPEDKLTMAEEALGVLDSAKGPEPGDVRIFELTRARASDVARAIEKLIPATAVKAAKGKKPVKTASPVRIVADQQGNRLIISAPKKQMGRIEKLVSWLDVPARKRRELHIVTLKTGKAGQLKKSLLGLFKQQAGRQGISTENIIVEADAETNSLIVSAVPEDWKLASQIIATLQKAASTTAEPITKLIKLQHAQAGDIASVLRSGIGSRPGSKVSIVISPSQQTNSLLITASQDELDNIDSIVKMLDVPATEKIEIRTYKIINGQAGEVSKNLRTLFAAKHQHMPAALQPRFEANRAVNQVLVAATAKQFVEIEKLIKDLQTKTTLAFKTRTFKLQYVQAGEIVNMLQMILLDTQKKKQQRPWWSWWGGRSQEDVQKGAIRIAALPSANTVIVQATPSKLELAESLIKTLDTKQTADQVTLKIVTLRNAQAEALTAALQSMLQTSSRRRWWQPGTQDKTVKVTISAIRDSNSVLIRGPIRKVEEIVRMIKSLDQAAVESAVGVYVIRLSTGRAKPVAKMIRDMYSQQIQAARRSGRKIAPLAVTADERANVIIISTDRTMYEQVKKLITTLDDAPAPSTATDVLIIPLRRADATQLAAVLNEMLTPGSGQGISPEAKSLQQQIRLLRLRSPMKEKLPELDLTKPIKITADPAKPQGTNSLIISSTPENLLALSAIVKILDSVPITVGVKVRVVHLKNANANNIRVVLQDIFARGQKLAGKPGTSVAGRADPESVTGKALVRLLNVSSDMRTNSLILSGEEEVLALAEVLISDLDKSGVGPLSTLRMFPLVNAEASRVRQVINSLYNGSGAKAIRSQDRPTVAVDTRTNTLVISTSDSTFSMLTNLIKRLDRKTPVELRDLRLLKLQSAESATIAGTLQKMMDARVQRQSSLGVKDVEALRVIILSDPRSNSLLVGGSAESFKIVAEIAKKLDTASPALGGRVQLFALEHGSAGTISATLGNLFNQRYQAARTPDIRRQKPIILPDVRTNSLLVAANADDTKMLKSLLARLDVKFRTAAVQLVVLPLKHNDAGVIGPVIQRIFQARLTSMTPSGQKPNPQDRVDVAAEGLSNSLIVSASRDNLELIGNLLKKVDVVPPDETGFVRMYPLKNSDVQRVATMLQGLIRQGLYKPGAIAAGGSESLKARERVAIAVDTRTNVLIVSASKENFAVIDEIIRNIDSETIAPASEFRIFKLENATAISLQATIQKLFDQRATRGKTREKVTVIADSQTNALIVGAPPEEMEMVDSLVKRLDILPADDKKTIGLFSLGKADAAGVAETLKNLFRKQGRRETEISISADERLNAIVVSAGRADLERIDNIVKQLDREQVTHVTEIKVHPLKNADAAELAKLLMDVLTQKPKALTKTSPHHQTLLQFINRSEQGRELITSALQEGVLITPDRRTNSLVVTAPLDNMPLLANLINSLDSTTPQSAEIRVFSLHNADATRMADVLYQLFRTKELPGTKRKAPAVKYTLTSTNDDGNGEPATVTTGSAQQPLLNVTVDSRTNSLLVGGTKQQVEMAAAVISELDSSPARERLTKVYHPRNAQAEDIASTITKFLDHERTKLLRALGKDRLGAAQRLLEREVAVVAEKTSNTLLISASPRYFRTLAEIIDELDRPPAQVLIQAVIAEVLLDEDTELGLDWGYTARQGNSTIGIGDNFKIEAGIGADPVGFNVSVTGGDMSFFLRALQRRGRLEVLSRPQILAADNQPAKINVGERVPLITSSRTTDQNDTINTISYEPVGVTLDVLPRIGSDRTICLEVKPTISSVGTRTTQISEHAEAVYLSNRSAETTVTCHDRQTVIIGGLITTTDRDVEDKVPVLGDIPGLGILFRNTNKERVRNELMIFLTPTILRSPDDSRRMTLREFHHNQTLKDLKLNHPGKSFALDSIYDPEIRSAAREGSNASPGPQEQRMQNLERTVTELELLPEQWYPTQISPSAYEPDVGKEAE